MSDVGNNKPLPLIRRPWFAFLSSMRFAVALLSVLAVASVIGTVLQQNQARQDYVVKFGPFWTEIFGFLGLFDVYASSWFVLIMLFLVLSTGLCLWRNIPPMLREMRSFRLKATAKSLKHMRHYGEADSRLRPEVAEQYLRVQGFKTKMQVREDGSVLLAAKKGAMNKWGYIFAHIAIIVICLGGLIDSNLLLKIGMLGGKIVPDQGSMYARDFKPESVLGTGNLSFRANAEIVEGQVSDAAFLNADKGLLLQKLPFSVELKKFHIDFYDTGMPRDFASDLRITDKYTGEVSEHTIRVNHPLTINGVTVYQASYGDGGSDLHFDTWHLAGKDGAASLKAVSKSAYPLDLREGGKYQIEFGDFREYNVEDVLENGADADKGLHEVRSVNQDKKFNNVGPTITFRVRDAAGQAHEYMNYMLPLERNGALYFATGERASVQEPYRWLMIPADAAGKTDSFMALRALLKTPEAREQVVSEAVLRIDENMREPFRQAVRNLLAQFESGGYQAINDYIAGNVPESEQAKTGELMYQILHGAMNIALDKALQQHNLPAMGQGETRNRFLQDALNAYTRLSGFASPVLLQMRGYKPVQMSGLQMTKAPGAALVYLGSLFLVLGTVFMFYVRDKRAWLLFENGRVCFAMSSSRSERDLNREFPEHQGKLQRLADDLHDKPHKM